MPTVGTTTEPTDTQVWYGLNSVNHHALVLTMPAGGPWNITRLGAWLAGMGETTDFKLCIWSSGGSLLGQTAALVGANLGLAVGNNVRYEANLITPVEVAGGASIHIGFARDPQDNTQFGTRSGTRKQWTSGSYPTSFGSWSSVSGAIGAYVANYVSANVAPNAPVSLSPSSNAVVNSGTAPVVSGTRSDPDSGDYITHYQILVYEDDGVTLIQDTGVIAVSGSPTTFSRTLALNGGNKYVKWKARTWDKAGVGGPYSALQRFFANNVPSTPGAPTVDVDDLTPDIAGSFADSGDTLAAVQIEVSLNAAPNTIMWSSGDLAKSGTSWSHTYAGSALAWGTAYRARYRVKDSHGAYSSWSAYKTWTTTQPVGPNNMTPRTTTPRLSDLTPDLTVGHTGYTFKSHEIVVRTVASDSGGATLWAPAAPADYALTNSKTVTYAGTALVPGQRFFWKSRIKDNAGTWSSWSPYFELRQNATPSSPNGLTPTGGQALTTLTPTFTWKFADIDLDQGDTQATYTIEVRNNATDALINTLTGTTEQSRVYSGTALAYETTYKWRIKVTDAMGLESAYSSYQVFKLSQPPSAALTAPSSGSTVTESTPTLDWAFSSPGGKAQSSFRIRVYDKGPTGANFADPELKYDSGTFLNAATSFDLPYGVLEDDHDYRWEVVVTDTDGLSYTLV